MRRKSMLMAAMIGGAMYSPLNINFADGSRAFDSRITFTRASSAMYCDSGGVWQTVGNDVARAHQYQHYDPDTLEAQGLWVEPQRTNSALYCRDFTNPAWVPNNITPTKTDTPPTRSPNADGHLSSQIVVPWKD